MQRVMTAVMALLALLSGVVEGQQFPGYGPPYYPPYPSPYGPYRPQEPSNARGVLPPQLPPTQPARQAAPQPSAAAPTLPASPSTPAMSSAGAPGVAPKAVPSPAPLATQFAPPSRAQVSAPGPLPAPTSPVAPPSGYPYGSYPGWSQPYAAPNASPWGQPAAQSVSRAPHLEVELGERQAYVQENILLRLRVISDQSLTKASPEPPSGNDFIMQKLDEPKVSSRTSSDGHREIVTEFLYALTPLQAGDLTLPSLRVTGEMGGDAYGPGQRFESSSSNTIRLLVRPALTSVQPWLPLRALSLKASHDDPTIKAGEPVSLILELDAVGASGSQLPSLESYLESSDFRVYREQTQTEARVSADGQHLEGKRTEHFTLVPRTDGRLHLPEVRLPWWNVTTGTREWASLPARLGGGAAEEGRRSTRVEDSESGWFWLGLSLSTLLLPMIGFAVGLRYRSWARPHQKRERLGARLGRHAWAAADLARHRLARVRNRLHPAPVLRRLGQNLQGMLPASSRFLRCLRTANREREPAIWARHFQSGACRYLPAGAQTMAVGLPPGLGGQVLRLRPGADPDQLTRLLRQLDGALYGGQDIDFRRWKRDFARQVGRLQGFLRSRSRWLRMERPRLPALNPSSA